MTPFHFGNSNRRLFGIYDPALKVDRPPRAVVICYPSGDEQIHAYRSLRQLAARLSQAGFNVLRFDYYGTGDSSGETDDGDIAGWIADIGTAIAELNDMVGTTRVSLVGLRLGANLAARVAATGQNEIDNLVLWQPLGIEELVHASREKNADPCQLALSPAAASLPPRTLRILTDQATQSVKFGDDLPATMIISASPWVEERTTDGKIPVEAIHYIVNWLT